MKKFLLIVLILFTSIQFGCDSVYKYVFMPPERVAYMYMPDAENMKYMNDTTYRLSKDSLTIIMDRKDFKIELKYMTDFQLNTFEFPDDSKAGWFSKNPFTYGDWIDPSKGYSPNRFSVFKITIYNYSGSKINFDPEESLLETDRGDKLNAYAREKKAAKYQSMEEYYLKRKGASGIDDEVFESRMGIVRRTMVYLGKPVYAGDSREGFIVFDPMDESVEKVKFSLRNFILSYSETNEPDEFGNYVFYFSKVKFDRAKITGRTSLDTTFISIPTSKDSLLLDREINFTQLQYTSTETREGGNIEAWNPMPEAIPEFIKHLQAQTKIKSKFVRITADAPNLLVSDFVVLLGGFGKPNISSVMVNNLAELLSKGGFLYIENSHVTKSWPYYSSMLEFLNQLANRISGKTEIKRIALDHQIYNMRFKFTDLPKGLDDFNTQLLRNDYIDGLFINGKLTAVLSNKGYIPQWVALENKTEALNFGVNLVLYALERKK
ncbi:MAG: DUF4159 domain-containing protein [Ignavibacteria bacterium]|nr:DUF4159 domain-containing protein [Ignavibacteria bacterium]